jgi:hypothetical protein
MISFKKVKILGVSFDVEQPGQEKLQEIANTNQYVVGLCDDLDDRLYVLKGLKPKAEKRTFVHEWAHGVKGVMGLNQTIDNTTAECICQSFANALLELLEQPEVMKFLTSKPKK